MEKHRQKEEDSFCFFYSFFSKRGKEFRRISTLKLLCLAFSFMEKDKTAMVWGGNRSRIHGWMKFFLSLCKKYGTVDTGMICDFGQWPWR